jgi:WD40 repeat protein
MENIWRPAVTELLRYSMSKQGQKLGMLFTIPQPPSLVLITSSVLTDENAGKVGGDLYIRSVRFSPDGKYLATGAEDKQIRVGVCHS